MAWKKTPKHLEKDWSRGGSYNVCWGEGNLLPYCLWTINIFLFCDLVFATECKKMGMVWPQTVASDLLQHPIVSNELWLNAFAIDVVLMCYMNYLSYLSPVKLEALSHSVLSRLKWKPVFMVQQQCKYLGKKKKGKKKSCELTVGCCEDSLWSKHILSPKWWDAEFQASLEKVCTVFPGALNQGEEIGIGSFY